MRLRSSLSRSILVTGLLAVPSAVQASASATVIVGPLAAAPVPTVSGYLLIVLGLLLAVIAFRTLRNNQGAQKLLGVLVLGGGLIISGVGVDRTLANPENVIAEGAVCTSDGPISYSPFYLSNRGLQNSCNNPIEIKGFSGNGCQLDTANANCKQGQVLAEGEVCTYLPKCFAPDV
jgi:IPTL-CTERM motif